MKKILNIFSILFVAVLFNAQTTTENYIQSTTCLDADCIKKAETVQYFDFLGRPKQVINVKSSPTGKDIVTPIVYDDLGRQTKGYLPIPQSGTQNGDLYTSPLNNASSIYGAEKIYSEKILDNSPLERVLQQKQVGNDWSSKSVTFGYDLNNSSDHVKKYDLVTTWNPTEKLYNNTLQPASEYQVGQLIKNSVTDEDGNTTVEFKDGSGQTVLIRKVMSTSQNADTYYVYNDYKLLTYVIPPLASSGVLDAAVVDNLCYQYKYDSKNRLVEKKLPGKGWEYMVYDKQDRLVALQDANLNAKGQWLYTKYDKFGRIAYTGINTGGTRSQEQAEANTFGVNNVDRGNSVFFNRQGIDVYYGSSDLTYPKSPTWVTLLSLNYYDSYPGYNFNPPFPSIIQGQTVLTETPTFNGKSTNSLPLVGLVKNIEDDNWTKNYTYYDEKGRAIGTYSVNHLGGYTKTESELDFVGLAKQTRVYHKRLISDTEKVITQTFTYDSQNRMIIHKHKVDNNPEEILAQNEYNELSQLKNKKVGGTDTAAPLQSIDYTYNIRGWLTRINDPSNLNGKLFGYEMRYTNPVNTQVAPGRFNGNITEVDWNNASENVLKRYNYSYDNLNRLQDAIYSEPNASTPFNNNFNENLTYDLNGNIKTLKRNAFPITGNTATQVDDLVYNYTGNRLNKVVENALNTTGYEGGNNLIDYDLNGNMINMKDKGIQSINYNYLNLPNQLDISHSGGNLGFNFNISINHLYRADGTKLRKTYYSARSGDVGTTTITDYLDGFQYRLFDNGMGTLCLSCKTNSAYEEQAYKAASIPLPGKPVWTLDFVATAEGFYSFTENRYIYQYNDHLGNTRVSFAKNSAGVLQTIDTNNYYPFGLNHIGGTQSSKFTSFYSYKYNGKELQETGQYDYGARMYMADIGRWGVIDAMAEKYRRHSPYNYAVNNPIMFIDPDGNETLYGLDAQNAVRAMQMNMSTSSESSGSNYFSGFNFTQYGADDDGDPPGNALSRFRDKTSNWVQDHIREPLSGWFDDNTRNTFALDAAGQARMDDFRSQTSQYMNSTVGGGIRWGAEHGLVGSGMGTGNVGAFTGAKASMRNRIANFAERVGIYSGQKALSKNSEAIIEGYYQQMKAQKTINPGGGFFTNDGKTILTEGNHRMNAAIRYALETGDVKYIQKILQGIPEQKVDIRNYNIPIKKFLTK